MVVDLKYRAFTTKHSGLARRIIIDVSVSEAYQADQHQGPRPQYVPTKALWDTGASCSLITAATANALGLVPTGTTMVTHVGGQESRNTYAVNIVLPDHVEIMAVDVVETEVTNGEFGAIIGMDIILQGDMALTNADHQTCLSFRAPPVSQLDFVLEWRRAAYANFGKNKPCFCGAKDDKGEPIKFKLCHGKDL
jgi:hypothetical protein